MEVMTVFWNQIVVTDVLNATKLFTSKIVNSYN